MATLAVAIPLTEQNSRSDAARLVIHGGSSQNLSAPADWPRRSAELQPIGFRSGGHPH